MKLILSYDGSYYKGWQKQKNTPNTVQETLERTLSKILGEKVRVIGAGRTDAGAHAIRQVANFKTTNTSIPVHKFKKILNDSLPHSIRIVRSEEVSLGFNARFSAKLRKYVYLMFLGEECLYPFISNYSYIPQKKEWNIEFIRELAKDFLGEHDFLAISSMRNYKSTIRFVKSLRVFRIREFMVFSIVANGFMYNMARGIVSSLLEAERRNDRNFIKSILAKDEKSKPSLVPPNGLYLHRVYY
ncbi:MAG: tRNA pseudouridine(38-40) synthase TruA [Brevinematia bacterium]